LAQDKGMRVYQLAKTLNVESKELLDFCKELGYDIKNQLSSLDPDQADALTQRVKQGGRIIQRIGIQVHRLRLAEVPAQKIRVQPSS